MPETILKDYGQSSPKFNFTPKAKAPDGTPLLGVPKIRCTVTCDVGAKSKDKDALVDRLRTDVKGAVDARLVLLSGALADLDGKLAKETDPKKIEKMVSTTNVMATKAVKALESELPKFAEKALAAERKKNKKLKVSKIKTVAKVIFSGVAVVGAALASIAATAAGAAGTVASGGAAAPAAIAAAASGVVTSVTAIIALVKEIKAAFKKEEDYRKELVASVKKVQEEIRKSRLKVFDDPSVLDKVKTLFAAINPEYKKMAAHAKAHKTAVFAIEKRLGAMNTKANKALDAIEKMKKDPALKKDVAVMEKRLNEFLVAAVETGAVVGESKKLYAEVAQAITDTKALKMPDFGKATAVVAKIEQAVPYVKKMVSLATPIAKAAKAFAKLAK